MSTLDLSQIRAVIFDMDGTMVANNKYHEIAWQQFLKQYGIVISNKEFKEKISGHRNPEIFTAVMGKMSVKQEQQYEEEKEELYRTLYRPHLREVPGLVDLLERIEERGWQRAVATTAPFKNRQLVLEGLGLEGTFSVIVGSEEVSKGKPDPQIYLKTAKKLLVRPRHCLVFEDSPAGVAAAKKAGMQVVAVLTNHSKKELKEADAVVKNFSEFISRYLTERER